MSEIYEEISEPALESDCFPLWKNSIQEIIWELSSLYPETTKKRKSFNHVIEQLSTDYFTINNNLRKLKDKKFNIQDVSPNSLDSEYVCINSLFYAMFGNFSNSAAFNMSFNSTLSKNRTGICIYQKEKYGFDDLKTINFKQNYSYRNIVVKVRARDINQIFEQYITKNLFNIQRNYSKELADGLLIISTLKPFFKILSSINFSSNDLFDKDTYYSPKEIYEKINSIKDIINLTHEINLESFLENFKSKFIQNLEKPTI